MSEKSAAALSVTILSETEIALTRLFNAPRKLVYEALSQPEHVAQWYGPHGFTMNHCHMDLRPGGTYRYVMRTPDGGDFAMHGEYREIVPGEKIVATESYEIPGIEDKVSVVTMTLEEANGMTTLTSRIVYACTEDRDGHLHSGMERGAGQTFDRLEAFLKMHP